MGPYSADHISEDLSFALYLTPVIASLWSALGLLFNRNRTLAQNFLIAFLFVLFADMGFSLWYDRYAVHGPNEILRSMNMIMSMLNAIVIYFYFVALMQPWRFNSRYVARYILFMVGYAVVLSGSEAAIGNFAPIAEWQKTAGNFCPQTIVVRLFGAAVIIGFTALAIVRVWKMYVRHRNYIRETFSYKEDIGLDWLRQTIILFAFFVLLDSA